LILVQLESAKSDIGFSIYAPPDIREYIDDLSSKDQNAILPLLAQLSTHGRLNNTEKCESEGDGVFALKPSQIRLVFFYDAVKRRVIIITHGYRKKSQKMPRKEFNKAVNFRTRYMRDLKAGRVEYDVVE